MDRPLYSVTYQLFFAWCARDAVCRTSEAAWRIVGLVVEGCNCPTLAPLFDTIVSHDISFGARRNFAGNDFCLVSKN